MKKISILIVEDESIVAMELKNYINTLGYTVVNTCSNAKDAQHVVSEQKIDIILMDICIKGEVDGIETAQRIKKSYPNIEIIFLTAHLDDYHVDRAIEVNPTAYLSKPFNREELRVFLKIALRKLEKTSPVNEKNEQHIILDDEFTYDPSTATLYCCYEMIHLTKKESDLLALLIQHQNNIVDFYTIENVLWPQRETSTNTIRTLIKRVREKLKHKFIETVPSRGYKLMIPGRENIL